MGNYAGTGRATALGEGQQAEVWAGEVISTSGGAQLATSGAVRLERRRGTAYPLGFSVELSFAADPGAFECDILVSDTDDLSRMVKRGSIGRGDLNSTFTGRAEFTATWCRFVALQMVSLTNAVAVTGMVTR